MHSMAAFEIIDSWRPGTETGEFNVAPRGRHLRAGRNSQLRHDSAQNFPIGKKTAQRRMPAESELTIARPVCLVQTGGVSRRPGEAFGERRVKATQLRPQSGRSDVVEQMKTK